MLNKKWVLLILPLMLTLLLIVKWACDWETFQAQLAEFPLQQKWSTELPQNIEQILIDENQIVLVRTDSHLYAFNLQTGSMLWKFETGWLRQNKSITAKDGTVFLIDNKSVWQIDEQSGAVLWSHFLHFPESAKIIGEFKHILVVFDSQQFFAYSVIDNQSFLWKKPVCRNATDASLQGGYIYYPCLGINAIDINTGEFAWKDESISIAEAVTYSDETLYFSQGYSKIIAYDLPSQMIFREVSLISDADQKLTAMDNFLFSTDSSKICLLNKEKLQVIWCARDIHSPQDFAIFEDSVYVMNGPANAIFYYSLSSGKRIGQIALPNFNLFTFFRNLIVSSSHFLVSSNGTHLFVFGR